MSATACRVDPANEDLVRAHVQALWLTETGQSLAGAGARRRARHRAGRVLASVEGELQDALWYTERWLDEVLDGVKRAFDTSCDRWRPLYRAALAHGARA